MNVRRAPCIVVISPRIRARPNRNKSKIPVLIGERVAAAFEIGIQRSIMLVHIVTVASRRISLPDLNKRVHNWPAIFIQHPPADNDALTKRFAMARTSEVTGLRVDLR